MNYNKDMRKESFMKLKRNMGVKILAGLQGLSSLLPFVVNADTLSDTIADGKKSGLQIHVKEKTEKVYDKSLMTTKEAEQRTRDAESEQLIKDALKDLAENNANQANYQKEFDKTKVINDLIDAQNKKAEEDAEAKYQNAIAELEIKNKAIRERNAEKKKNYEEALAKREKDGAAMSESDAALTAKYQKELADYETKLAEIQARRKQMMADYTRRIRENQNLSDEAKQRIANENAAKEAAYQAALERYAREKTQVESENDRARAVYEASMRRYQKELALYKSLQSGHDGDSENYGKEIDKLNADLNRDYLEKKRQYDEEKASAMDKYQKLVDSIKAENEKSRLAYEADQERYKKEAEENQKEYDEAYKKWSEGKDITEKTVLTQVLEEKYEDILDDWKDVNRDVTKEPAVEVTIKADEKKTLNDARIEYNRLLSEQHDTIDKALRVYWSQESIMSSLRNVVRATEYQAEALTGNLKFKWVEEEKTYGNIADALRAMEKQKERVAKLVDLQSALTAVNDEMGKLHTDDWWKTQVEEAQKDQMNVTIPNFTKDIEAFKVLANKSDLSDADITTWKDALIQKIQNAESKNKKTVEALKGSTIDNTVKDGSVGTLQMGDVDVNFTKATLPAPKLVVSIHPIKVTYEYYGSYTEDAPKLKETRPAMAKPTEKPIPSAPVLGDEPLKPSEHSRTKPVGVNLVAPVAPKAPLLRELPKEPETPKLAVITGESNKIAPIELPVLPVKPKKPILKGDGTMKPIAEPVYEAEIPNTIVKDKVVLKDHVVPPVNTGSNVSELYIERVKYEFVPKVYFETVHGRELKTPVLGQTDASEIDGYVFDKSVEGDDGSIHHIYTVKSNGFNLSDSLKGLGEGLVKPKEEKPVDVKPTELVKPKDEKPGDVKPTELVKPKDENPGDVKPTEPVKPKDEKPVDVKPTEPVKPTEEKPVDVKPIEPVKPTEEKPVDVNPTEPVKSTEPVKQSDETPADVSPTEPIKPMEPTAPIKRDDEKPVEVNPKEQSTENSQPSTTKKSLPETGDVSLLGMGIVSLYGAVKMKKKNHKK